MLKTMTVERYRAFVAPATIELRPLTVLYGQNSRGKSTLLRSLPLVAASCGPVAPNRTGPLALEHVSAMGARFADIRTHLVARNDVGVKLSWDTRGVNEIEFGLRDVSDLGPSRQVVSRLTIREDSSRDIVRAVLAVEADRLVTEGPKPTAIGLDGIRPRASSSQLPRLRGALASCEALMTELHGTVDWLGPIRVQPPRFRVQRVEKAQLGAFGESLTEVLGQPETADLLRAVNVALQTIFSCEVEIAEEAGEISLAVRVGGHRAHLLDVGAGVAQVLPVLVRLAEIELGRSNGHVVAMEQPETHLHPDAEVALATVIVRAIAGQRVGAHRPRLVLETHSENLLLSLQLAILEERLASDDVVLYWFSRLDDGSIVLSPTYIDSNGRPDPPLPPGAFSENLEIARQILRARSRRG